jgi:hypothetical protein
MSSYEYISKARREYLRDGLYTCATPSLKSGTIAIPVIAVLSLIALAAVLRLVLLVPEERFFSLMLLYIVFYLGLIVSFPLGETERIAPQDRTAIWASAIILITLGIIAVSAS